MFRRRMKFETMGNIEIPKYYVLTQEKGIFSIEAAPEEKEALEAYQKKRADNIAKAQMPRATFYRLVKAEGL